MYDGIIFFRSYIDGAERAACRFSQGRTRRRTAAAWRCSISLPYSSVPSLSTVSTIVVIGSTWLPLFASTAHDDVQTISVDGDGNLTQQ